MHALPLIIASLCILTLGYRFYSLYIATNVVCLEEGRVTPANSKSDGRDFVPTNRLVVFGHHFAAIAAAGPLIGPVLAAQFGWLPGAVWILIGAVLGGAVHDFIILWASMRENGDSIAAISKRETGSIAGVATSIAVLFIVILSMAGLAVVVVNALAESPWGFFTILATIPIALIMGFWMHKWRPGDIKGATIFGLLGLILCVCLGGLLPGTELGKMLTLSKETLSLILPVYGFIAAILPVWALLAPRDYLSSWMKIGVIGLLAIGTIVVNPHIQMPALTKFIHGGGPIIPGPVFPFVFITIACGAVSGFHSLIATGTTPKLIKNERDCRFVGYGAMVTESFVAIMALIAATTMMPNDYYAINGGSVNMAKAHFMQSQVLALSNEDVAKLNLKAHRVDPAVTKAQIAVMNAAQYKALKTSVGNFSKLSSEGTLALGLTTNEQGHALTNEEYANMGIPVNELPRINREVGEDLGGRTGGAVSLAAGMANIFGKIPGFGGLMAILYHFVIMFEALFILTAIDAGTRVARYLLQEALGRIYAPLGDRKNIVSMIIAGAIVSAAWGYLLYFNNISSIWPMFGVANQLMAVIALAVGTTYLLARDRRWKVLTTLLPMIFMTITTCYAGYLNMKTYASPAYQLEMGKATALSNLILSGFIMSLAVIIVVCSVAKWSQLLNKTKLQPISSQPEPAGAR